MSVQFSAKLSLLRLEKGITQKQAAKDLGISQALLSHYEKGIRECNLDFVRKAAEYYEVTADYLLGMTASRRQTNDLFDPEDLSTDNRVFPKTILRSLLALSRLAESDGESAEMLFCDFFSLCVKKYETAHNDDHTLLDALCDVSLRRLCDNLKPSEDAPLTPTSVQTVCDHALLLMNNDVTDAFR